MCVFFLQLFEALNPVAQVVTYTSYVNYICLNLNGLYVVPIEVSTVVCAMSSSVVQVRDYLGALNSPSSSVLPGSSLTVLQSWLHTASPSTVLLHSLLNQALHTCLPAQCAGVQCTPAYLYTCIPAHLHTCTPAHLHTCTPAHLNNCTPKHLNTCTPCTHAHTWPLNVYCGPAVCV